MDAATQAEFNHRLEVVEARLTAERATRFRILTAEVKPSKPVEYARLIDAINIMLDEIYSSDLHAHTVLLEEEFEVKLECRLDQLDAGDDGADTAPFDAGDGYSECPLSRHFLKRERTTEEHPAMRQV